MADFFSTLFGGGAEREAADRNRAALGQYSTDAMGYLKNAYDTGTGNLNQAVSAFTPLANLGTQYNKAGTTWLDALGVNGADAAKAAQSAFTTSPGYTQGIDAGLNAINRARSLAGGLSSGKTDLDALTFAQNAQNQQYNTWLQNLAAGGQQGIGLIGTAAQGQAGGYTNLANLASQYGQNQSGVAGNVVSGNINANNLQAQGEASGAKNLLGAGLSLASLAMTGGMGGGLGGIPGAVGATSVGGAPLSGGAGFNWGNTAGGQLASGIKNLFSFG